MELAALVEIMARLRDPDRGCPWDLEQSFATVAPYTIEEAYEVADAIERGDLDALSEELGDLLFQVVFHAQLAREAGAFGIDEVVAGICEKMRRRHPHVFGDAHIGTAAEQTVAWDEHKRRERGGEGSALDGVPLALPGLARAVKLGRRAARVGFDWSSASDALGKLEEEIGELRAAIAHGEAASRVEQEIGDLLFSVANVCRHLGTDPESALRGTNLRFETRFRYMEQAAAMIGRSLDQLSLTELDQFWEQAKQAEDAGQQ